MIVVGFLVSRCCCMEYRACLCRVMYSRVVMGLGSCLYPFILVCRWMCLKSFIFLCRGVICGSLLLIEVHRVEPKNE